MRSPRILIYTLLAILTGGGAYYYYFVYKAPRKLAAPPPLEKVLPAQFLAAMKPAPGGTQVAGTTKPGGQSAGDNGAKFTGNATDKMSVTVKNTSRRAIPFALKAGEIYGNDKNRVVLLEGCERTVPVGGTIQVDVRT